MCSSDLSHFAGPLFGSPRAFLETLLFKQKSICLKKLRCCQQSQRVRSFPVILAKKAYIFSSSAVIFSMHPSCLVSDAHNGGAGSKKCKSHPLKLVQLFLAAGTKLENK